MSKEHQENCLCFLCVEIIYDEKGKDITDEYRQEVLPYSTRYIISHLDPNTNKEINIYKDGRSFKTKRYAGLMKRKLTKFFQLGGDRYDFEVRPIVVLDEIDRLRFQLKKKELEILGLNKELELRTNWTNHHKRVSEIDAKKKYEAENKLKLVQEENNELRQYKQMWQDIAGKANLESLVEKAKVAYKYQNKPFSRKQLESALEKVAGQLANGASAHQNLTIRDEMVKYGIKVAEATPHE
jgi:hypothetical protein